MRKVCRWYSRTFKTPLDQVENLPTNYVLQHYWETIFEDLEDDERQEKIIELIETPEERKVRIEKEKTEEDAFVEAAIQEELNKAVLKKKPLKRAIKEIEKAALKPPAPPPNDIEMKFVDENLLEEMIRAVDDKGSKK